MGTLVTTAVGSLFGLARGLTLPVLRAIGSLLFSLTVPVLRASAVVCLIIAAVALASDLGTFSTATPGSMKTTSVIQHWQTMSPITLDTTRTFLTRRMRPWVWDAFSTPLKLPAFGFFSLLGLVVGYLGRRRQRINIFAN